MSDNDQRILDTVNAADFPLLWKMLNTRARPFLLQELKKLLSHRWSERAPRRQVEVLGRLRGSGLDQAVFVRNISDTGVLLEVEFPRGIRDDGSPLCLVVQTNSGLVELGVAVARTKPGTKRRQIAFELADGACLAAEELRNLYYGGLAADT